MKNNNPSADLPIGFGMALAMNPEAMKAFSSLPESGQKQFIDRAGFVKSKAEMEALVRSLTEYNPGAQG